ncbi:ParB N-terminal domain-containing protein|uniref:ParB-like nuclease domain-containing protein n=1 Tax=Dendrosporobacter quercicolus TaxID=146817 RepID=A0A1G9ZRK0_9FIRM|nr:ParB/Srx family N-terminal domain-containing protein [Dendrosporobacter quercicolus]NSL49587.1 ParB N-terminal domain-containing protein [Dendrosporobacter quercicolus DSM 1736]SDN23820.1 ParB-like nuclease domain-containing protein [Dendrosporobacter quercicolus]
MNTITAGGIAVHCSHDEIVDISTLIPHPRNPHQHPDKQIQLLARIIQYQGWRTPITVSIQSGYIVRGHGRLLAALYLDVGQVPIDCQNYSSEEDEYADLIADNRIAELAVMDPTLLAEILEDLQASELDLDLTGYNAEEFADIVKQFSIPDQEFPEYDESVADTVKKVTCPQCGHEFPV